MQILFNEESVNIKKNKNHKILLVKSLLKLRTMLQINSLITIHTANSFFFSAGFDFAFERDSKHMMLPHKLTKNPFYNLTYVH